MRIFLVHPLMSAMGGGERLCCETIRVLKNMGHALTLVSAEFSPGFLEGFFGYQRLFDGVEINTYRADPNQRIGRYEDLIRHVRAQKRILSHQPTPDLVFSTQDPAFIPEMSKPVLQWGYFPTPLPKGLYGWPMRAYYAQKTRRINLVLAISQYSKSHLDQAWKVHSRVVYPACNMIQSHVHKENTVVTAARGVPEKRLELFWEVAKRCPSYKFVLLLTKDPRFVDYSKSLQDDLPRNGQILVDPRKDLYQDTLARSRFYLHLMKGEHFGITVVEAMSAGCLPIVHDSGGPKEIVGDSGFLWRRLEDIPALLDTPEDVWEPLSKRAVARAGMFSRERFDSSLSEVLGETS